jgi:hypothetical protein
VEILCSPVSEDEVHLWVLVESSNGDGPSSDEAHEACARILGSDRVVSFAATLFDDRSEAEPTGAPTHVLMVPFAAPADQIEDLDRWYAEEHIDWLLSVPGWLRTRRFDVFEARGEDWTRVVLHDLAGEDLIRHPEVVRSQQTEWRKHFSSDDWFMAGGRSPLERL